MLTFSQKSLCNSLYNCCIHHPLSKSINIIKSICAGYFWGNANKYNSYLNSSSTTNAGINTNTEAENTVYILYFLDLPPRISAHTPVTISDWHWIEGGMAGHPPLILPQSRARCTATNTRNWNKYSDQNNLT